MTATEVCRRNSDCGPAVPSPRHVALMLGIRRWRRRCESCGLDLRLQDLRQAAVRRALTPLLSRSLLGGGKESSRSQS